MPNRSIDRPKQARFAILAAVVAAAMLALTGPARAAEMANAELIADHISVAPGATFKVAILPDLKPGQTLSLWADGAAGTTMRWSLPDGFTLGRANWPSLERVAAGDGAESGWRFQFRRGGPIVQEIVARPDFAADGIAAAGPLPLSLSFEAQVCAATCQPEIFTGRTTISLGAATPGPRADLVERHYRATLVFRKRHVAFRVSDRIVSLALTLDGFAADDGLIDVDPSRIASAVFLPLEAGVLADPRPMVLARNSQGVFGQAALAPTFTPGRVIEGLFVALDSAGQPIYVRHIAEPSEQAKAALMSNLEVVETGIGAGLRFTILTAVLFALLGGLILNIMPCVFPILALKAFALMKSGGASEQAVRREGLAYTVGIVVSFLLVGLVITSLRATGDLVGWGFQLQQPGFVLAMILILFAVGLNFLGLFAFSGRWAGLGQGLVEKEGTAGAFSTGVLAALVATPCTAPFMAPAIAYALGVGTLEGLSIFFALGLGLALPFLAISYVPALRRRLPKPGAWMQTAKEFLAFPIFATVIWLVWVLETETGGSGLLVALGAILLLGLATWLARTGARTTLKRLAVAALVVVAITPVGLAGGLAPPPSHMAGETLRIGGMEVEVYGPERLEAMQERISDLRVEGKSVFVHFWASWCIICLTHDNLVYSTAEYQTFLADNEVVFMVVDNTLMDSRTNAMMQIFGADGQPLDVFFPANGGNRALVMPKIFTTTSVLDQMKKALGGP